MVMHQVSVLSPSISAVVVDVSKLAKEGLLSELMYVDDLCISETIEGVWKKLKKRRLLRAGFKT